MSDNKEFVETGHYYSAVPNMLELQRDADRIWNDSKGVCGIDMNEQAQLKMMQDISEFSKDAPWHDAKKENLRFYCRNGIFEYMDALFLYGIMRMYSPKNIIEIGSGFSSAVMLDTSEKFLNDSVNITLIEPFTERLNSLLMPNDIDKPNLKIINTRLQDVQIGEFDRLGNGDILFVDSTHVLKTGSDVDYILGVIIPRLAPGVIIHVHDIHWPFVLYKQWAMGGRAWNEVYAMRSFLQFNSEFEIISMLHWIAVKHFELFSRVMPEATKSIGNGLWIRRKTHGK